MLCFTDLPTLFCDEQQKKTCVFICKCIKLWGEAMWLPVHSLIPDWGGVNYHVAIVEDGSLLS